MATFSYNGMGTTPASVQSYTVQQAGTYDIAAFGAQGGGVHTVAGGRGAETGGYFNLTAGEKLKIVVGGTPTYSGGRGDGNAANGGGGGGGSFVLASTNGGTSYSLLLVAGGGGGTGYFGNNTASAGVGATSANSPAGSGAGGAGGGGLGGGGGGGAGFKGGGGTGGQPSPGTGAASYTSAGSAGRYASNGGFGGGGGGGNAGGGGGGGGYTGGAAGAGNTNGGSQSAGKGGTSIDKGTPIAAQTLAAVQTGSGQVTVTLAQAAPAITSEAASPTGADLDAGKVVTFTLQTNESVMATGSSLALSNGATAAYASGNGTASAPLTYSYTVASGDTNTADLQATALNGTVQNGFGFALDDTTFKPIDTMDQVDTVPPRITAIADSGPGVDANGNGDLNAGKTVTLTVTTSEPVTVNPGQGGATPTLTLNDGGTATYTGGSGTAQQTFSTTVAAGQNIAKLAVTQVNANGATVTDAAGNPISTSLAGASVPSGTLIIDTTAPVASSPTLTAAQNAPATPIGIAAPSDNLTPAGSLAIAAGALPTDGTVTLSDGTTPVTAGQALTAAQLTGLEFTPTPGISNQGSTFTYKVTDGAGNASTGTAALNVGSPGAPTITGTHATSTTSEAAVTPFTGVTIADPSAATETLTIALTGAGGMLAGAGLTANANGTYVLTGSAGAVTAQLDALRFAPTAGAASTTSTTTFVLTDASSAGTSVTDAGTSVADTDPARIPIAPGSGGVVGVTPADAVSLSSQVTYRDGVFTLAGTASSAAGVSNVEITATVGGRVRDLGPATLNADGTFTFQDAAGQRPQGFITATETDGAGVTTSAQADYSLTGGLSVGQYTARETSYTADGSAVLSRSLFRDSGQRAVDVEQGGQTLQSAFKDHWNNHGAPESTFVFTPGYGQDVVNLFRVDGTDHDTLSFKGSDFGTDPASQLAAILANTQDARGGAVITDPTTKETVQLLGISAAKLTQNQGDFTFHA